MVRCHKETPSIAKTPCGRGGRRVKPVRKPVRRHLENPDRVADSQRARIAALTCSRLPSIDGLPVSVDRVGQVPRRRSKATERSRDRSHADPSPGVRQPLDPLVKPVPRVGRRQRLAPRRGSKLTRRQPRWPRTPPKSPLGRITVCSRLLGSSVSQRTQAAGEPSIRRRRGVLSDRILPATLGQLQLLLRPLKTHGSGTTRCLQNDGSSDGSAKDSSCADAARNASRSDRRTIHRRGPAFEARKAPELIQRRTVTTVT